MSCSIFFNCSYPLPMDEALEWAKRCPKPHYEDCEIEIRPVFELADFGPEFNRENDSRKNYTQR